MSVASESGITPRLAEFIAAADIASIPEPVRHEARRALLNYIGCAIGGSRHPSITILLDAFADVSGPAQATLFGRGQRANVFRAALANGTAGCVDAFCDTHAEAIIHPSAPVMAATLAYAEHVGASGADTILAMILGLEVACRLSKAVSVAPASGDISWSQTGITGAAGATAALARLMKLNPQQTRRAISLGAAQGFGFRVTHGSMATPLMHAQGAETGLRVAMLAARGFTCAETVIEGKHGFASVFADTANLAALTDGLGSRFELSALTYKPFPCGIVAHPIIDVCLRAHADPRMKASSIKGVQLAVHPNALALTGRRDPKDPTEAQFSLYHWAAVALLHGTARISDTGMARIGEPAVAHLRGEIETLVDPTLGAEASRVTARLDDGEEVTAEVAHCVGSASRPMTDDEIETKVRGLAEGIIPPGRLDALVRDCRNIETLADAGDLARHAG